ncbi:hypothetical protein AaE_012147 [Aphanomyces astaci]|uniref:Uncharacterized protein n=1 Tax=Aphanomyces astaci TaxID=112090 RepID=A0A6A4ZE98_APHAT|nr:hypothetical protein AaE_012147 [Aphanomyces astaci]
MRMGARDDDGGSSCVANIVLEGTCERHVVGNTYCDIPLGLYIIRYGCIPSFLKQSFSTSSPCSHRACPSRGENIVLMGELDQAKEAEDVNLTRKSAEEVLTAEMEQNEQGLPTVRDAWNFDHPSQH